MNIGEAATQSGLPAKTIRYYEDIGLVMPAARLANGYRDYALQDVHTLQFINRARSLGFSVEDCRALVALYADRRRKSADVRELALARMADIDHRIEALKSMRRTLQHLVEQCSGNDMPDCPILDDLAGKGSK